MAGEIRVYKTKHGEIKIEKVNELEYLASSESKKAAKLYRLAYLLGRWYCSCKGFSYAMRSCKHVAAMKKIFAPKPPKPKGPRRRIRARKPIKVPPIKCRHCRSTRYTTSFKRKNKYSTPQVYRCLDCHRRFTPDNGFLFMTYRGEYVVEAIEDRCACKTPHNTCDSLSKKGGRPHRTTLYHWFVKFPRMVTPYLLSLEYNLGDTMYVDEIIIKIGGVSHVVYSAEDLRTRMNTATQIGRFKGSHSVRRLYRMDIQIRGGVAVLVITDGAKNFISAHELEMRYNVDEGKVSMHIRNIHMDGNMNTNMIESLNATLRMFEESIRGVKTPHTTYFGMHQINYNFVRTHSGIGMRPSEAAGVVFEDLDKWRAIIACAADYNNARKLGKVRVKKDDPRRAGFQVIPLFRY